MPGQAHVDVVGVPQVDLGGAAGALADHHVVLGAQLGQGGEGGPGQPGPQRPEVRRRDRGGPGPIGGVPGRLAQCLTEQDDLAGQVAARLQQHRVEPQVGREPAGGGLHGLGPADLPAPAVRPDHHRRVVGHVLRLERGDVDPPATQPPADTRRQHALAGVRGGAGNEQPAAHARARSARPRPRSTARRGRAVIAYATATPSAPSPTLPESLVARRMCRASGRGPSPRKGRTSERPK